MSVKTTILSVGLCSLLLGCGEKAAESFCKSHAKEHDLHRGDITQVHIDYSEQGKITAQVKIAQQYTQYKALITMVDIIEVKADSVCTGDTVDIKEQGKYYQANYSINCGLDNKLSKVSVPILENFKAIDEVEVVINTPSSNKHFVLSSQCDSPIFNVN